MNDVPTKNETARTVGEVIESSIQDLAGLFVRLGRTGLDFTFRPTRFRQFGRDAYTRPITFIAVGTFAFLIVAANFMKKVYDSDNIQEQGVLEGAIKVFLDGVVDGKLTIILSALLPLVLAVFVFSWSFSRLANYSLFSLNCTKDSIQDAISYSFGSLCLWHAMLLPFWFFSEPVNTSSWVWYLLIATCVSLFVLRSLLVHIELKWDDYKELWTQAWRFLSVALIAAIVASLFLNVTLTWAYALLR